MRQPASSAILRAFVLFTLLSATVFVPTAFSLPGICTPSYCSICPTSPCRCEYGDQLTTCGRWTMDCPSIGLSSVANTEAYALPSNLAVEAQVTAEEPIEEPDHAMEEVESPLLSNR